MFRAPHTIWSGSPDPTRTVVSDRRSGARVLLDRQELAHHDVAPLRAPALETLDLEPEQREALRQGVRASSKST